jgi:hypothetical protein
MPAPQQTPTQFIEVLQQVWWRLDGALDADMIYWSAALGAVEAAEWLVNHPGIHSMQEFLNFK